MSAPQRMDIQPVTSPPPPPTRTAPPPPPSAAPPPPSCSSLRSSHSSSPDIPPPPPPSVTSASPSLNSFPGNRFIPSIPTTTANATPSSPNQRPSNYPSPPSLLMSTPNQRYGTAPATSTPVRPSRAVPKPNPTSDSNSPRPSLVTPVIAPLPAPLVPINKFDSPLTQWLLANDLSQHLGVSSEFLGGDVHKIGYLDEQDVHRWAKAANMSQEHTARLLKACQKERSKKIQRQLLTDEPIKFTKPEDMDAVFRQRLRERQALALQIQELQQPCIKVGCTFPATTNSYCDRHYASVMAQASLELSPDRPTHAKKDSNILSSAMIGALVVPLDSVDEEATPIPSKPSRPHQETLALISPALTELHSGLALSLSLALSHNDFASSRAHTIAYVKQLQARAFATQALFDRDQNDLDNAKKAAERDRHVPRTVAEVRQALQEYMSELRSGVHSAVQKLRQHEKRRADAGPEKWIGISPDLVSKVALDEKMDLARLMWVHFQSQIMNRQGDNSLYGSDEGTFFSIEADVFRPDIVDVRIVSVKPGRTFDSKIDCIPGYNVLSRSFDNRKANLNKGGTYQSYLCYKLRGENDFSPAVTGLALLMLSKHDQLPFCAEPVMDERDVVAKFTTNGPTLCMVRGLGPSLTALTVVLRDKITYLPPPPAHECILTAEGREANINIGTVGVPTFFCINPDVRGELLPFRTHLDHVRLDMREHIRSGGDASELMAEIVMHEGQAKTLACLVAAFYSADETTVMMSFHCFRRLAANELFPEIVNLFIQAVCRAIPLWLTYFKDASIKLLLEFVEELYEQFGPSLSARSLLSLMQACLLLPKTSMQLAQTLIAHLHSSLSSLTGKVKPPPSALEHSPTQICSEIVSSIAATVISSKRTQILAMPLSRINGKLDAIHKLVREIRISHSSKVSKVSYCPEEVKSNVGFINQSLAQVRRRCVLMATALRQSAEDDVTSESRLHMRVEGKNTRHNSPDNSRENSHNSRDENPIEMSVSSRVGDPSKMSGYELLDDELRTRTSGHPPPRDKLDHSSPRPSLRLLDIPIMTSRLGDKDQDNSDDDQPVLELERLTSQDSLLSPDISEEDNIGSNKHTPRTFEPGDDDSPPKKFETNTHTNDDASNMNDINSDELGENQKSSDEKTEDYNMFSPSKDDAKTPDFSLTKTETFEKTLRTHKPSVHTRKMSLLEESRAVNSGNPALGLNYDECLDTLLAVMLMCYQILRTSGRCGEYFQSSELVIARALTLSTHQRLQSFVIQLLSFVVSDGGNTSVNAYQHHPAYGFLLRRFICPSLCRSLVHPSSVVFDASLELTALLVSTYQLPLSHELGILLDGVILGLLDCDFFRPDRKLSILNFILSSALTSPDVLIELFYNYDLHPDSPNVVQHLILAVTATCESVTVHEKVSGERSSGSEAWASRLRLTCVSLLAHIVFLISAFSSPDPKGEGASGSLHGGDRGSSNSSAGNPNVGSGVNSCSCCSNSSNSGSSGSGWSVSSFCGSSRSSCCGSSVSGGAVYNHALWKIYADRKYFSYCAEIEALKCYKRMLKRNPLVTFTESERVKRDLEGALICLKNMYPLTPNREMAGILCNFLTNHASEIDPLAVGELLSVYESDAFNKELTEFMRETFVFNMDFVDESFDQALRKFVEDNGFRMPVEKLKTERMMKTFCRAYDYQNPGALTYSASAVSLAMAMHALRCELARERGLPEKASVLFQGKVPSLPEFTKSLQRFGTDLDQQFLSKMYDSVKKQDHLDRSLREAEDAFSYEEQQEAKQVKVLARLARKAESRLNQMHTRPVSWEKKSTIGRLFEIERHLFEVCWPGLAQCFALGLRSADESFVGLCLLGTTHARDTGRKFCNSEADYQLTALVDGLSFRSSVLTVKKAIFSHPNLLRDRRLRLRTIHNCLQGDEVVEWLVQQALLVCSLCEAPSAKDSRAASCARCKAPLRKPSRPEAVRFGEALSTVGMLPSVPGQTPGFKDNKNLYHFGTYIVWSNSEVSVVDEQRVSQSIATRSAINFPAPLFDAEKTTVLMRNLRTKRLLESMQL